jgi:hypothetical protein
MFICVAKYKDAKNDEDYEECLEDFNDIYVKAETDSDDHRKALKEIMYLQHLFGSGVIMNILRNYLPDKEIEEIGMSVDEYVHN